MKKRVTSFCNRISKQTMEATDSSKFRLYDLTKPYDAPILLTLSHPVSNLNEWIHDLGVIPYHPFGLIQIHRKAAEISLVAIPNDYVYPGSIACFKVTEKETGVVHLVLAWMHDSDLLPYYPPGLEGAPQAMAFAMTNYAHAIISTYMWHKGVTYQFRLYQQSSRKYIMVKILDGGEKEVN